MPGIYVEILIRGSIDEVWQKTQTPVIGVKLNSYAWSSTADSPKTNLLRGTTVRLCEIIQALA